MMLLSQEGALGMLSVPRLLHHLVQLVCILLALLGNTVRFLLLCLRPPAALVAENLFFRKHLALYQERRTKPRRATNATRITLVWLSLWSLNQSSLPVTQHQACPQRQALARPRGSSRQRGEPRARPAPPGDGLSRGCGAGRAGRPHARAPGGRGARGVRTRSVEKTRVKSGFVFPIPEEGFYPVSESG